MNIDTSTPARRAMHRENTLKQPCYRCEACKSGKPRKCVRLVQAGNDASTGFERAQSALAAKKPESGSGLNQFGQQPKGSPYGCAINDPNCPGDEDCEHVATDGMKINWPDPEAKPNPLCGCHECNPRAWWMVVCGICGNKRCPHASDHRFQCSGSNASGQTPKIGPSCASAPNPDTFTPKSTHDSGNGGKGVFFVIPGQPMGKPRMVNGDKWKKRPVVQRYWAWKAKAKDAAPESMPTDPICLNITAYLEMPKSWSANKRAAMAGQPHRQTPDYDNLSKACSDALFPQDSGIARGSTWKFWEDGKGPRMEVFVC